MDNSGTIEKMICPYCGKHLDVTDLEPFERFHCPLCDHILQKNIRFERYDLIKLCGIGGMAKVYEAIDSVDGKTVAIKINNNDIFEENKNAERFIHEADLVSQINHPGIVKIYRGGIFNHKPFLVMEFMKKGNLESLQKNFMLPDVARILSWLATIAEGLYEAYKIGIVHHDVKPANIMLSEDGEVKIGDFDLAEISHDGVHSNEAAFASLAYVSPERLISGSEGHAGDIFSLGVSAYELLTGEYPFGNSGTPEELLKRRENADYMPVKFLNSTIDNRISNLIDRMLAFHIEDRPSYQEIIDVFRGKELSQAKGSDVTISGAIKKWFGNK
ncbi:MAG: serine/threonine protein kinase [Lentisphaeria bacterium]|nr:serine/threonine protein kinase [Lentisphaeria bacterium]